jgi:sensor histidine kinase YesM
LTGGIVGMLIAFLIGVIRAIPTFLLMICLLYLIPKQIVIAGSSYSLSGFVIVVLSLIPYAVAYVFDNFSESIRQWRKGQMVTALQLLPNLSRMYFILIMSSSSGAAIGVNEGVTTLLHYATRVGSLQERLVLYAVGILFFGILMQTAFALINYLRAIMIARVSRRVES